MPSLKKLLLSLTQQVIYTVIKLLLRAIGLPGQATHVEIFDEVAKGLEAKYKMHIIPKPDRQWLFINTGGWMASFYLMHASLTEYVYFMGTAMQTSGHAGKCLTFFRFECPMESILI